MMDEEKKNEEKKDEKFEKLRISLENDLKALVDKHGNIKICAAMMVEDSGDGKIIFFLHGGLAELYLGAVKLHEFLDDQMKQAVIANILAAASASTPSPSHAEPETLYA
jgi:hypothetical protein